VGDPGKGVLVENKIRIKGGKIRGLANMNEVY